MDIEQDVINVTTGTAITTCNKNLNKMNNIEKVDLIIIDPESSESSNNESDIEVVNQYKLDDIRPVIGNYGKYICLLITIFFKVQININKIIYLKN